MYERLNNPVLQFLGVFVLGLILSLGHVDAVQAQAEPPKPGTYEGGLKVTCTYPKKTETWRAVLTVDQDTGFVLKLNDGALVFKGNAFDPLNVRSFEASGKGGEWLAEGGQIIQGPTAGSARIKYGLLRLLPISLGSPPQAYYGLSGDLQLR